ncbi:hypothetical protein ABMA57_06235 [Saccharospirillum sp. HFRX-1]|uniref:hypothetical protein n=1 Tax=unclassified Saccharospirillum TaxID=2633430 RepID=UPI00371782CE
MKKVALFLGLITPILAMADWPIGYGVGLETQAGGYHWATDRRAGEPDQEINLGSGMYFYGVAVAEFPWLSQLELRSRLGVKTNSGEDDDVAYSKRSFPVELGVRYTNDCTILTALTCGFFVEAGAVHQFNARYTARGNRFQRDEFSTEASYSVRAGWYFFYVSYWHQEYQLAGETYDASSVNFGLEIALTKVGNWAFGLKK